MSLWNRRHDSCRLITSFIVVFSYFIVEVILGHICHSLSLQADAFQMLSRSIAIFLSFLSVYMENRPPAAWNTFGWHRASVVGPLINSIMLQTFCITILFHVLERVFEREDIHHPLFMLYVGVGSLTVNMLSLIILNGTVRRSHRVPNMETMSLQENVNDPLLKSSNVDSDQVNVGQPSLTSDESNRHVCIVSHGTTLASRQSQCHHKSSLGKYDGWESHSRSGDILHSVLDFLIPIIVMLCALINWLVPQPVTNHDQLTQHSHHGGAPASWQYFVDPIFSLIQITIMSSQNIPTMIRLMKILMQNVPPKISYPDLNDNLLKVHGVQQVHDLHIWPLKTGLIIGTVHVIAQITDGEMAACSQNLKNVFHTFGIHCTTIQLEKETTSVSNDGGEETSVRCRHLCPGSQCIVDECCNMGRTLKASRETIHSHSTDTHEDVSSNKSHRHHHHHQHDHHNHSHRV